MKVPPVLLRLSVIVLLGMVALPTPSFAADSSLSCATVCPAVVPPEQAQAAKAKALDHPQVRQFQRHMQALGWVVDSDHTTVLDIPVNRDLAAKNQAKVRYTITVIPVVGKQDAHGAIALIDDGTSSVAVASTPSHTLYWIKDQRVTEATTADLDTIMALPFYEIPGPDTPAFTQVALSGPAVPTKTMTPKEPTTTLAPTAVQWCMNDIKASITNYGTIGAEMYTFSHIKTWCWMDGTTTITKMSYGHSFSTPWYITNLRLRSATLTTNYWCPNVSCNQTTITGYVDNLVGGPYYPQKPWVSIDSRTQPILPWPDGTYQYYQVSKGIIAP